MLRTLLSAPMWDSLLRSRPGAEARPEPRQQGGPVNGREHFGVLGSPALRNR